jgi:hypothetical protein
MSEKKNYKAIRKQIEDLKKESKTVAKAYLLDGLKDLFAKFPEVGGVTWTQGTPSFNDGDPCTFSSGHKYPDLLALDEVDVDLEELEDMEDRTEVSQEAQDAFPAFLGEIHDDDMELIFGDGFRVTIDRKLKVKKDEYYD